MPSSFLALWLLASISRLESVRPLDQGAEDPVLANHQQTASLVEVGTRHLSLAKGRAKGRAPDDQRPNRVGNQIGEGLHDEWADDESLDQKEAASASPGAIDAEGNLLSGSASRGGVVGQAYQNPVGIEEMRGPSLHGGYASGSSRLDHLAEQDEVGVGAARAREGGALAPNGDPLFVPLGAELSHRQRNDRSMLNQAGGVIDTIDNHDNHFREFLNYQPAVDRAVESYKTNIGNVKHEANNVVNGLDSALTKMHSLYDTVANTEKNVEYLGRDMNSESRESGIESVDSFKRFNQDGVKGYDKNGEWAPNAGKWKVFKDLLFPKGKRIR